jgi:hypothetical protein
MAIRRVLVNNFSPHFSDVSAVTRLRLRLILVQLELLDMLRIESCNDASRVV